MRLPPIPTRAWSSPNRRRGRRHDPASRSSPAFSYRGGWRGQIEAVRVAGDLRGKGLGAEMIDWAVARCRERGCLMAQLTSNNGRTDAHRFYERLGWAKEPCRVQALPDGRRTDAGQVLRRVAGRRDDRASAAPHGDRDRQSALVDHDPQPAAAPPRRRGREGERVRPDPRQRHLHLQPDGRHHGRPKRRWARSSPISATTNS